MGVFGLGVLLISLIFKSVCWLMSEKFIKMVLIENVIDVLFIILYFMVWCCINIVYIDIGWLILLKLWVWRISIDVLILIFVEFFIRIILIVWDDLFIKLVLYNILLDIENVDFL